MTTPAPDQGALERARKIFRLMTSSSNPNDHITALAAALTAAASEARAAAIAIAHAVRVRAAENETVKPQGVKSLSDLQYLAGFLAGKRHAAAEIERELRALATPAQSEGK